MQIRQLLWTRKKARARALAAAREWQERERQAARERLYGVAAILDRRDPTLAEMERAARTQVVDAGEPYDPEPRSVIRELLLEALPADEVNRLEIAPGRWYLPGTPP